MFYSSVPVFRFHEEEVTPVVTDVSKFMETLLNDCSGEILDTESDFPADPEELSFLVLRVIFTFMVTLLQATRICVSY